jgi:hypothetical protein
MTRPFHIDRRSRGLRHAASASALVLIAAFGAASTSADDVASPAPPVVPAEPPAPPVSAPVPSAPRTDPDRASPSTGKAFPTREAAAEALFAALRGNDDASLRALMGAGNDDLVTDGKDPIVAHQRAELAAAATAKLAFEPQPDGRVTIVVGSRDYPLALPLVAVGDAWRFDAAAGRQELLARRIGENELEAIGVCLAYVDAQVLYASKDRDGDGVKSYAQRLVSVPGAQDGLYWATVDDDDVSPAGPGLTTLRDALVPEAAPEASFDGYHWRILTAQGSHAPGGAYSYVLNGRMLAGFALLAVPATHRNTGVMSFLVSNQGKVYEKDLGADSRKTAAAITTFDPDASWREVDAATLRTAAATSPEDVPYDDAADDVPTAEQRAPGAAGSPGDTGNEVRPGAVSPTTPTPTDGTATTPCPPRK